MPIATSAGRQAAAAGFIGQAAIASLHTADPGTTGANELTGGSPAYARQPIGWTDSGDGVYAGDVDPFDVPASTVTHVGLWASDGTTFLDASPIDPATYTEQGLLTLVTLTYTQV